MSALRSLRLVALLEGISLALLVLVGMPLKHAFGIPGAVRVLGSVHGILFLAFVATLVRAAVELRWPASRALRLFAWSLVPGGVWPIERDLRAAAETERRRGTETHGP